MKRIQPFERMPFGHGVVYRDPCRDETVVFLVPFNWFLRWARQLWYFLAASHVDHLEKAEAEIKKRYRVKYEANQQVMSAEMNRRIKKAFDETIRSRPKF